MGPLNPSDPEAFRRFHERWKARAEAPYARAMGQLLVRVGREASKAVENSLDPFAGPEMERHAAEVQNLLETRNRAIARSWGGLVRRDAKSFMGLERKGWDESFELWLDRWIATYTAAKVVGIAETTRQEIRRAIRQGQTEELGSAGIARLIRERTRVIGAARAMTIARTETGQASNAATGASADALGVEYMREWSAASSERTRQAHRDADGQRVGRDEAFTVGGEKLMHPGDPNGSAAMVCNCRCAVALRVD